MGKITVSLSDETERRLREYVTRNYPLKPFGKLGDVMEKALKEMFDREAQP